MGRFFGSLCINSGHNNMAAVRKNPYESLYAGPDLLALETARIQTILLQYSLFPVVLFSTGVKRYGDTIGGGF